ncbi:hypothetical protein LCGC14_0673910 [marine sediment metagenome]|uniref:WLM domain-containing protein n=1 Tax=marine sediment metagenome TaxID=412755 RepID=A0A0F9TY91_9ZZZZ
MDKFEKEVKTLRQEFPVHRKVVIRRLVKLEDWGRTTYGDNQITISIDKNTGEPIEILIHEWAHIRCNGVEHSECWGKEYAKIYSKIIGVK